MNSVFGDESVMDDSEVWFGFALSRTTALHILETMQGVLLKTHHLIALAMKCVHNATNEGMCSWKTASYQTDTHQSEEELDDVR